MNKGEKKLKIESDMTNKHTAGSFLTAPCPALKQINPAQFKVSDEIYQHFIAMVGQETQINTV